MKKNRIKKALIITASVIIVLFIGISVVMGGYIADRILHQNKDKDTADNSVKQLEVWNYDLDGFNSRYKGTEISATASDGNVVPGTFFDNESDKCAVLVHGAGGDRVSIYPLAQAYLENGYDVIAIDQRGCGMNADDRVTFGINESLDVMAVVSYAREVLGEKYIVVHGQSMGAQTSAIYASKVTKGTKEAADAVIIDSPVPGMELMLRYMFGDGEEGAYSPMVNYLIATSKTYMKVVDKIDYDDADTIKIAGDIEIPVMVIVSKKDEVCLPEFVEKIYDNISIEEKAIEYVDSAHIEGVIDDPSGYMESVNNFLRSVGIE